MRLKYNIEIPMVKHGTDKLFVRLEKFAERFQKISDAGHAVSMPDNPMGNLSFQGHELIKELKLIPKNDQVMIHLNTFHSLKDIHDILDSCGKLNVRNLLIISGDGSTRLPKLQPGDIGSAGEAVTSVELLAYIRKIHGDFFRLGVAYSQYEPAAHEDEKLRRKLDAGAEFIITQPVLEPSARLDNLVDSVKVPVILEAWMSPKVSLLSDCVGYEIDSSIEFNPLETLNLLQRHYLQSHFYLAVMNFTQQFDLLLNPQSSLIEV